jgi:hypothetical protein
MKLEASQGSQRQAEIQQAIQDAQQAVQAATQEARAAQQEARAAAQEARAAASEGAAAPRAPGTIVIPTDGGGPPVTINVDRQGIHVTQSGTETVIPIQDVVPRGAVLIAYSLSAALIAVAVVGPLLRFFLRRVERRQGAATLSAGVQARLDAMERNIDTVAVELERVSEGQRFTNRLLEQRPVEHAQRIDR